MDNILIRKNMLALTKVTINIQAGNMNEFTNSRILFVQSPFAYDSPDALCQRSSSGE